MPTTKPTPLGTREAPVRKRRGFPVVPTLMVAIAVPILMGFGFWQLQRLQWKEAQLVQLAANSQAPLLKIDGRIPEDAQFRRIQLTLSCDSHPTALRAGRNLNGKSGYSHIASCRTDTQALLVDTGWTERPDPSTPGDERRTIEGTLVHANEGGWLLVDARGQPPLAPSAPPGLDTISNNHLSYAIQWFSFAAILLVIYGLWLRRWLAQQPPAA